MHAWLTDWSQRIMRWRRNWANRHFSPGTLVNDRYRLIRKLGEGSFGVSYLCRDETMNEKLCVLKRIHLLRGHKKLRLAIFAAETAILSRLQHPAIPTLYATFTHHTYPCMVMEYVPGMSLEQYIFDHGGIFSETAALTTFSQLLELVADLHAEQIVHRDLRIANIMMQPDSLALIDFGLARQLQHSTHIPELDTLDADDPPEKQLRRALHVSSDFYALGHVLLFMLYSAYPAEQLSQRLARTWEQELAYLNADTKKLIRRLLQVDQPYEEIYSIQQDTLALLRQLTNPLHASD
jgi:serine/threonine-protein kinase